MLRIGEVNVTIFFGTSPQVVVLVIVPGMKYAHLQVALFWPEAPWALRQNRIFSLRVLSFIE
jgi:hypothetical protein